MIDTIKKIINCFRTRTVLKHITVVKAPSNLL